jgi:DNA polymerase III epsilon subunit-like protein
MGSKILWIDTETTGLSDWKNGIIQISGFIEIDGEEQESFNFRVRPFPQDEVHSKALEVNGIKRGDLAKFPAPQVVYRKLIDMLDKYIDKFDPADKFELAGYNIGFDKRFLASFFKKNGDNYFHSYVDYHLLDVMSAVQIWRREFNPKIPNIKLATVCEYFGIDANFHDAMDDIRATKEVYVKVMNALRSSNG